MVMCMWLVVLASAADTRRVLVRTKAHSLDAVSHASSDTEFSTDHRNVSSGTNKFIHQGHV